MSLLLLSALAFAGPFDTSGTLHTLDNGLTVILEESHRTDTVALHITYNVGAYDEEPAPLAVPICSNTSCLRARQMYRPICSIRTTEAGGENNAWTSNDETAYHMTFPSGALDRALFLESDRLAFLDAGLNDENVQNQHRSCCKSEKRVCRAPRTRLGCHLQALIP